MKSLKNNIIFISSNHHIQQFTSLSSLYLDLLKLKTINDPFKDWGLSCTRLTKDIQYFCWEVGRK